MTAQPIPSSINPMIRSGTPRRVLLLQGLMGPFSRKLGLGLRKAGHEVFKVNFNGGDRAYWRLPNGIDYRGTLSEWPEYFAHLLRQHKITDVRSDEHKSALQSLMRITSVVFCSKQTPLNTLPPSYASHPSSISTCIHNQLLNTLLYITY